MTADRVKRERRAVVRHVTNLAVRHEPELDERLKPVADTEDESVTIQQLLHRVFHVRFAEQCRDKLARAVRLVTARKAARKHENLALADAPDNFADAVFNIGGGKITDHEWFRNAARAGKRVGRIDFAVGTRERGDKHARLSAWPGVNVDRFRGKQLIRRFAGCLRMHGEHARERIFEFFYESIECNGVAANLDACSARLADALKIEPVTFKNNIPVGFAAQLVEVTTAQTRANAVAERHFGDGREDTAPFHGAGRGDLSADDAALNLCVHLFDALKIGHTVCAAPNARTVDAAARLFKFGGDHMRGVLCAERERHKRGRHVDVFECA